jgi:hypothetical protein
MVERLSATARKKVTLLYIESGVFYKKRIMKARYVAPHSYAFSGKFGLYFPDTTCPKIVSLKESPSLRYSKL